MPGPGSATSPLMPLPPASMASSTGPPGPCRTAFDTSSVTIISARQRSSESTPDCSAAVRTASRARAGACDVAGSSRLIEDTSGAYPGPLELCVDALADDSLHFAAVRAALRGLHHGPDDCADRLVVAAADLLDRIRVVGHRLLDDALELVGPGLAEAALGNDRRRVTAVADEHTEHLLCCVGRHLAAADHGNELRQRGRLELGLIRRLVAQLCDHVVAHPVGQRARVRRVRRQRGLEQVAQLAVVRELLGLLGGHPEFALQ